LVLGSVTQVIHHSSLICHLVLGSVTWAGVLNWLGGREFWCLFLGYDAEVSLGLDSVAWNVVFREKLVFVSWLLFRSDLFLFY